MPDFSFEEKYTGIIAGVDEAGRGPWAGPVVAATMVLERSEFPKSLLDHINDSKSLTQQKREKLFEALQTLQGKACFFAAGQASVEEIDQYNILQATYLAMERAVQDLPCLPEVILLDGRGQPKWPHTTITIIKGDRLSYSIAAASIIAKVTRDRIMRDLGRMHPEYGWDNNAGYGTAFHQKAIATHGLTPHHRRSFRPIKEVISGACL